MGKKTTTYTSGTVRAVTPNDSTDFAMGACRALYIGTAGDVSIVDLSGETVVFVGALAGSILPIQTARVNTTGTTASDIVALF